MTEDEAYDLLATHRMTEHKEHLGVFYCSATFCPHQYNAPESRKWQAHRRHWAKLIADAITVCTEDPCRNPDHYELRA